MIRVSIIIPVHNRREVTRKGLSNLNSAIENYYEQSKSLEFKIILVDDGSTDKTSDMVSVNYPQIEILLGNGNLWWSGAINVGVNHALDNLRPDFIMFWNDDLTAKNDYFVELEKVLFDKKFNNSIIASKILYDNEENSVFYNGAFIDFKTGKLYHNRDKKRDKDLYVEADWTGGMGVLFPSEVFNKIGFVDNKNFPQYYGDADFSLRAKKAGFRIFCHRGPSLLNDRNFTGVYHNGSIKKYFQSLFSIKSPYCIKIHLKFAFKHFSPLVAVIFVIRKQALYLFQLIKQKVAY